MKGIKFLLLCLLLAPFSRAQEFKYSAGKAETVVFQNLYADLRIEGYKGNDLIIKTKNFKSLKTDPRSTGLKSAFNMDDNTGIGLKVTREGDIILVSSSGGRYSMYRKYIYEVKIPESLNLEVLCKNKDAYQMGSVHIKAISRSLVFENNYGNLIFEDISGPASIAVESGNIEGTFSKLSQKSDTYISSLYGMIDITLPDNTPANLYLKNSYGDIFTDFNIDIDKEKYSNKVFGSGIIEGKINGGGVRFQIKSESNNIYLRRKSGNTRTFIEETLGREVPRESANLKKLAEIDKVGDSRDMTAEFQLDKEQQVRIFALGERDNDGEMADLGYIERADKKDGDIQKVIWKMKERETRHAGGADKNRLVDISITLPAGKYILHYTTDDSHSYDDWNMDPPDYDFWGIAVFAVTGKNTGVNKSNNKNNETIKTDEVIDIRDKDTKKNDEIIEQENTPPAPPANPDAIVIVSSPHLTSGVAMPPGDVRMKFKQQLYRDNLIKLEKENECELSQDSILINGEKQIQEVFEKYKKLYEKLSGNKLNSKVLLKFD